MGTSRVHFPAARGGARTVHSPGWIANPNENHLFSLPLWTVIWKEKNKMVGDLCVMGEPNAKGELELKLQDF